jgi:putative membrane protein
VITASPLRRTLAATTRAFLYPQTETKRKEYIMRAAVLLATVPLLIATPLIAQQGSSAIGQSDKEFLDFAAKVNQSEIQGGLAAEKKAEAPAVRAFARLMVLDHMELESQLAGLATENGIELPSGPSDQAKQETADLQGMSGAKFDAAYMQDMVQGHEHAVQKFRSEQGQAQAQAVKAVVAATLPILEQHLALAQAVQSEIQNQGAGTVGSANKRK